MHFANLSFAAGPEGLDAAVETIENLVGAKFKDGGFHPRFGTRNHILPLTRCQYLEVVEVLEHPAADKAPFGQAVRARTALGGGWLGWVMSVDDLAPFEQRIQRQAITGSRQFPDGRRLEWKQLGVKSMLADPQLPFFIKWISDASVRPCALGEGSTRLAKLEINGSRERVSEWLGFELGAEYDGIEFEFTETDGPTGIAAVTFETPNGIVRI